DQVRLGLMRKPEEIPRGVNPCTRNYLIPCLLKQECSSHLQRCVSADGYHCFKGLHKCLLSAKAQSLGIGHGAVFFVEFRVVATLRLSCAVLLRDSECPVCKLKQLREAG